MTEIPTDAPVLVTGATGYLASRLICELLKIGVTVHTTVRNKEEDKKRYEHLLKVERLLKIKPGTRLKIFEAQLLKGGSYKKAMDGCRTVFHVASPYPYTYKKAYDDVVAPTTKGTKNVLNQAKKTKTVKRVVMTSSSYAMHSDAMDVIESENGILDEAFWNESASLKYQPFAFGKSEAEKDAWSKFEKQDQWDLITICPGLMLGPGIKCHREAYSVKLVVSFGDGTYSTTGIPEDAVGVVDVREVVRAHIQAAFVPTANGRYLLSHHETDYYELSEILRERYPDYHFATSPFPKSLLTPVTLKPKYVSRNVGHRFKVDGSRCERELGIRYRPLKKTLFEMFDQIIEEGLLDKERMKEEKRVEKEEKKEEDKRIKEEKKEAKAKRKEARLKREAEEKEQAKIEKAEEKERKKQEKLDEKERKQREKEEEQERKRRERDGEIV